MDTEARVNEILRRRRRTRIAVLIILVLCVFFAWFPSWSVSRAKAHARACLDHLEKTGDGEASSCRQGGLLWLPRHVPWTWSDAGEQRTKIDEEVDEVQLWLAARRDLDRAARDREAAGIVAEQPQHSYYSWAVLERAGTMAPLYPHAGELRRNFDRMVALVAAVRDGDEQAMRAIASLPSLDDEDRYRFDAVKGMVWCALGDGKAGLAALATAHAGSAQHDEKESEDDFKHGFARVAAAEAESSMTKRIKLAELACGTDRDVQLDSMEGALAQWIRTVASGGSHAAPPAQTSLWSGLEVAEVDLMVLAGDTDPTHYAALFHPGLEADLEKGMPTPWEILDRSGVPSEHEEPDAPAWDDVAAQRLAALADGLPAKQADLAAALRWGAMTISLDAAPGWVRRGDLARARASVQLALALAHRPELAAHDAAWLVIPYLHLAGDAAGAAAELATVPSDRTEGAVERALLLADAGKLDDAWKALEPGLRDEHEGFARDEASWVRAALALRLGRPLDLKVSTPEPGEMPRDTHEDFEDLGTWWQGVNAPADRLRELRWKLGTVDGTLETYPELDTAVLSAQLFVIGKLAGTGDVEVWLDVVCADRTLDPQVLASARAEAARWRGDTAAAAQWDHRLAALRALGKDDRAEYLLRIASSIR